jgi:hypothetical protein
MSGMLDKREVIKVAIALDASPFCLALSNGVVAFSDYAGASVDFICVEDENLIKLSNQPLAKPISLFSSGFSAINKETVEQMLKLQKTAARKAMETAVGDRDVGHSLIVKRGVVRDEIMSASNDTDLLILGWSGWRAANYYGASTIDAVLHRKKKFHCDDKIGSSVYHIMKKSKTTVLALRDRLEEINSIDFVVQNEANLEGLFEKFVLFLSSIVRLKNEGLDRIVNKIDVNLHLGFEAKEEQIEDKKNILADFANVELCKLLEKGSRPEKFLKDVNPQNDSILMFLASEDVSSLFFDDKDFAEQLPCSIMAIR